MAVREKLFSITKKDLEITWFSGTGDGGMNRNAHQKCCRIVHPESGAMGTGQDERSREQNLRNAFKRLVNSEKFKTWLRIKTAESLVDKERERQEITRLVDNAMKEENLKIEFLPSNDEDLGL
jgi:protein subunit release factor A